MFGAGWRFYGGLTCHGSNLGPYDVFAFPDNLKHALSALVAYWDGAAAAAAVLVLWELTELTLITGDLCDTENFPISHAGSGLADQFYNHMPSSAKGIFCRRVIRLFSLLLRLRQTM